MAGASLTLSKPYASLEEYETIAGMYCENKNRTGIARVYYRTTDKIHANCLSNDGNTDLERLLSVFAVGWIT